jgi:hypothetical protein
MSADGLNIFRFLLNNFCSESRICSQIPFSVIGRLSRKYAPPSLDAGKIRQDLRVHVIGGFRNNLQDHRQFLEQLLEQQVAIRKPELALFFSVSV